MPGRPRTVLNTAAGAFGAWLRWPALAASRSARLRGALSAVLWGGLLVLLFAAGFVKAEIPATNASIRAVGQAMLAASLAAAALMAAGAVIPAIAVILRARAEHRPDVLRLVAAPVVAGVGWVGFVAALSQWARHSRPSAPDGHSLFYVISVLFLAAAIITGWAPTLALRRIDPGARVLAASVPFGALAVAALAVATALMAAYTVMLGRYEPWLAHSGYGMPWQHQMMLTILIGTTVAMALGTALAATGLAQGTLGHGRRGSA